MPPKAAPTDVLRGRGRPKRQVAPEPAPVANAPAKRGRAAKADIIEVPAETPRKRGRPAKVPVEESAAVAEAPEPKKRMGRPAKKQVAEVPAATPKKRAGRPAKTDAAVAVEDTSATPKRRGRPAKNATTADLNRVAGTPRVTKSRAPSAAKATPTATAPRINPRVRSKLRTRLPPAQNIEKAVVAQPTKGRGRPPKTATKAQPASPKKAPGRKATKAAVTKPAAPRKKRGYTTLEVPDKFAAQVQQYLQELNDAASLPTPVEEEAEEVAEEEGEDEEDEKEEGVEAEAGADVEEVDMIIEEEVIITSAPVDQDNVMALTEQANQGEDFSPDAEPDADMDTEAQEHDIQDDTADKHVAEEPSSAAPEVELDPSLLQEVVQAQFDADNANALEPELDPSSGNYGDDVSPLMGEEEASAMLRDAEPTPSTGFLFGQTLLSS
jgi:hypothetical protein